MPRISSFVALRYDVARVGSLGRVTAPPYDVISHPEHERLVASSEHNVIRLDLGVAPDDVDGDRRYLAAGDLLREWRTDGVLVPTNEPVVGAYEMRFRLQGVARRLRGVVAAVELEAWGGAIVPHERTLPGPVEDRLRLLRALRANLSCIECVYLGPNATVAAWLDRATSSTPDAAVVDEDLVEHLVWIRPPSTGIEGALRDERLMIADGHHRYTTALRYRDEMRAAHGAGPWDAAMMLLVDATLEDPPVLPFHRIVVAGGAPPEGVRVRDLDEVLSALDDHKLRYGSAVVEQGKLVHRVGELEGEPPVVCRLHEQVIPDASRLRFTPDAVAAEEAVRDGAGTASYFLPATDAATIRSVIDRGERLPEKSTFFWPKPRTGLLIRPHDVGDAPRPPRGAARAS